MTTVSGGWSRNELGVVAFEDRLASARARRAALEGLAQRATRPQDGAAVDEAAEGPGPRISLTIFLSGLALGGVVAALAAVALSPAPTAPPQVPLAIASPSAPAPGAARQITSAHRAQLPAPVLPVLAGVARPAAAAPAVSPAVEAPELRPRPRPHNLARR